MGDIHYEVFGTGDIPVLMLHGGPGSGLNRAHQRYFDLDRHRVVMFDQRGAGQSGAPGQVTANSTQQSFADAEALREAMGFEDWVVVGGSWGGALALAYAAAFPHRTRALVARSALWSQAVQEYWLFVERPRLHPEGAEARDAFLEPLSAAERQNPAAAWLARLIEADEAGVLDIAARIRMLEDAFHGPVPNTERLHPVATKADLARTQIYLWYWMNGFFLPPDGPADLEVIAGLPHAIIHGADDLICPAEPYRGHPGINLIELPGAGHDGLAEDMIAAIRAALASLGM